MNALVLAGLVLICTFGGALIGMWLRTALPSHHLDDESRDAVKLAMGLIATMSALILGFVIASAKSDFDEEDAAVKHSAANILTLDRVLARYGPESAEIRKSVRGAVDARLDLTWPESDSRVATLENPEATPTLERIVDQIQALSPESDAQRWLQSQALELGSDLLATRWLVLESAGGSIPPAFLVILIFWLTLIMVGFGLFTPRHTTTIVVLFLCALSVAAAIFLILEMDKPFEGIIKIPAAHLRYAQSHLGQ